MDVVDNMPMNVVMHTWFHIASCVVSEAAAADFVWWRQQLWEHVLGVFSVLERFRALV